MRICLFDENRLGVVKNETVRDVTSALEKLPSRRYPFPQGDALIGALPSLRDAINATAQTSSEKKLSEVRLLSPVANPSKVMGAPVNYQKHLNEVTSDPNLHHQNKAHMQAIHQSGFFLKANSSIVGPSEGVAIRHTDRRTDEEVELALVIGRRAQNVPAAEALDYLAGYCIGLDISIRGLKSAACVNPWTLILCSVRGSSPPMNYAIRRASTCRSPSTASFGRKPILAISSWAFPN